MIRSNANTRQAGLILVLFLATTMWSCQKIVSIDLNKTDPHMVIEGIVTDRATPDSVVISESGNYFEPSLSFPPVTGAYVTIADNSGNVDTLKEIASGTYKSLSTHGTPGSTYTLRVISGGKEYDAVSSMPQRVAIDSLYATPRKEFDGDVGYDLYVVFKDPPETGNYYRINLRINRPLPPDSVTGERYHLLSDKLINGNEVTVRMRTGRSIVTGDTVFVELLSIDKSAYDYFRTLNNILTSDRAPTALAPANPTTNISNGSLGYFAAFTVDSKTIVLK